MFANLATKTAIIVHQTTVIAPTVAKEKDSLSIETVIYQMSVKIAQKTANLVPTIRRTVQFVTIKTDT